MSFYLYQPSTKKRLNPTAPLVAGQTLYLDELPTLNGKPDWSIELDAGALEGKIRFGYSLNGATKQAKWSPPYVVQPAPLDLKPGNYDLSYIATPDGEGTWQDFKFVVMATKPVPVVPATEIAAAEFGTNLEGANYPGEDFGTHPELATAFNSLKLAWARDWEEEATLAQAGDAYWAQQRKIKAAGIAVALQLQYPNKQMWSDHGAATIQKIIAGGATHAILFGNEVNTRRDLTDPGTYYLGSEADLTAQCTVGAPLCEAAGVIPVAPSRINDLAGIASRVASGAYGPIKNVDQHLYSDNETWLISQIEQFDAFCNGHDLQGWVSEWNLRMLKGETLAQWGVRVTKVLQAFQKSSLIAIHFSGIPTGHPEDDVTATLDAKYQPLSLSIFKGVLNPAQAK